MSWEKGEKASQVDFDNGLPSQGEQDGEEKHGMSQFKGEDERGTRDGVKTLCTRERLSFKGTMVIKGHLLGAAIADFTSPLHIAVVASIGAVVGAVQGNQLGLGIMVVLVGLASWKR